MKLTLAKLAAVALLITGFALGQAPSARVRVVHASPDAPPVDIYVDGAVALDGIPFRSSTDYVALPAGQRIFQVFVAGTQTRVAEVNVTLSAGASFTVIATGFATPNRAPGLRLLLLQDTLPLDLNSAYIRVVHGAPSAPAVDVFVGAPFQTLRNRSAALSNVPFGANSNYLGIPGNTGLMARVTPAGTRTIAIQSGRLALPMGAAATVIAVDATGGGTPFDFVIVQDR
jgi:hypothetical protein